MSSAAPRTGPPYEWTALESLDPSRQSASLAELDALLATTQDCLIEHDPRWLRIQASEPGKDTVTWLCTSGNRLIACAPMLLHPSTLSLEIMGKTLYQMPIERMSLTGAPVIAPGVDEAAVVQSLLAAVAGRLGDGKVGFVLGLPSASSLAAALAGPLPGLRILKSGPEYSRRTATLSGTYDAYLQILGSKTRKSLRYQETQLRKHTKEYGVRAFTQADQVPEFLLAAQQVSQKTYQWHLLGQGVSNTPSMRTRLQGAAELGWLRSYVLYCDGVPAAFMLGYLYKGCFSCVEIGYDPAWARFSVGNILHLEVLRDLTSPAVGATVFDFLYGDSANKERLTNRAWLERNYYLIPRTPRMAMWMALARGFNATTESVGRLLDRYDLKTRLRRLLRRHSVKQSERTAARPSEPGGE